MKLAEQSLIFSGRLMLLVAHPDDECIGAGILMQRNRNIHTVFATSGAPNRPYIWRRFGTPGRCARIRQREARNALALLQTPEPTFLNFSDGKLYRKLAPAYERLANLIGELRPSGILTHAYESGHPDHDACSFLGRRLADAFALQVWEMPYYRPDKTNGRLILQQFLPGGPEPLTLTPDASELRIKQQMFEAHRSQGGVLADFDPCRECFRCQPGYDYGKKPLDGSEAVGPSRVPARDLAAAFQKFACA